MKLSLRIRGDLCDVLSRVMGKDLIQPFAQPQDLTGMDIDIGRLPLEAAPGLVNHDRECGSVNRFPAAPPARITAPMLAAWPMHTVLMLGRTNCIVS